MWSAVDCRTAWAATNMERDLLAELTVEHFTFGLHLLPIESIVTKIVLLDVEDRTSLRLSSGLRFHL
jgi:hypothetical protein